MPEDKSPFYHGWFFDKLFDPQLDEGREVVLEGLPRRGGGPFPTHAPLRGKV